MPRKKGKDSKHTEENVSIKISILKQKCFRDRQRQRAGRKELSFLCPVKQERERERDRQTETETDRDRETVSQPARQRGIIPFN